MASAYDLALQRVDAVVRVRLADVRADLLDAGAFARAVLDAAFGLGGGDLPDNGAAAAAEGDGGEDDDDDASSSRSSSCSLGSRDSSRSSNNDDENDEEDEEDEGGCDDGDESDESGEVDVDAGEADALKRARPACVAELDDGGDACSSDGDVHEVARLAKRARA